MRVRSNANLEHENLCEVDRAVGADPHADGGLPPHLVEQVTPMAGAVHPARHADGHRVDIAVRVSEVLAQYAPVDARISNALAHRMAVGVVVRRALLLGHPAA